MQARGASPAFLCPERSGCRGRTISRRGAKRGSVGASLEPADSQRLRAAECFGVKAMSVRDRADAAEPLGVLLEEQDAMLLGEYIRVLLNGARVPRWLCRSRRGDAGLRGAPSAAHAPSRLR